MSALRNTPGGSGEGADRLWRLLNVVLVVGSVAATLLAVGVVIGLFYWLYTLPPLESERPRGATPPSHQVPRLQRVPGREPAAPPHAAVPSADVPKAVAPAAHAAAEPGRAAGSRRTGHTARDLAGRRGHAGAPSQ